MAKGEKKTRANGVNSFIVNIRYRNNSTWQGTLSWMNGQKTCEFRSALEMFKLMEEAMEKPESDAEDIIL